MASASRCRRRDRHAARPQRRRQDHDPAQPGRAHPGARGPVASSAVTPPTGRPIRIAALGVGYVPEGRRIFANLTVEENLKVPLERPGPGPSRASTSCFRAWPSGAPTRAASSRAASRRCWRSRARCCSIRAADPRRALPGAGAADRAGGVPGRGRARAEGISVLLVEQNVRAAVEIADRAYVLDDGRVVYSGPAAEFARTRSASARWPAPARSSGTKSSRRNRSPGRIASRREVVAPRAKALYGKERRHREGGEKMGSFSLTHGVVVLMIILITDRPAASCRGSWGTGKGIRIARLA